MRRNMDTNDSLLPKDPVQRDVSREIEDLDKINYDLSPDNSRGKLVITSHGEKGAGKTYGVFLITSGRMGGFPAGKTVAISFDNKTKITKEQHFPTDDITVYDGKRYYREDPTQCTKSGMMTYKYMQKLLESYKVDQPDWIVFDGFTVMAMILEMAMRYKHGLQPSEGIANRNVWKDRARFVQDIHNVACRIAKYGVAYVTYSDKNEIVESGTVVSRTDVPKYVDVVMQETDVVLHATKAKGKDGDLFYIRVESTKYRSYVDINGEQIPRCDTTLEQGRTFNISGMALLPPKKVVKKEPTATEKMIESIVPPKKEKTLKAESTISVPIEPIKQIETAKVMETAKSIEIPKSPEVKPQEIKQEAAKPVVKTKFEIPNLLSL
jgi:hypothetical protein